jgi:3-hydroxyacyl-[acyl-carrier-protein] dehydratase
MRFRQLDKITHLRPGAEITALRTLSHREAYFRDHFPQFPVMPGVLTLEAMFQACNWLVRATDEFAHSVVVLKEARNVKFSGLVRPGQTLTVSAAIKKHSPSLTTLSADGNVDGATVASGRLVLERFNLADRYPLRAPVDGSLRKKMQAQFALLQADAPGNVAVNPSTYRWMWIDRFTEFVSGRRAVAIKTVSMTDEPIDLYLPGFPVMPCSLIIEGFGQTGGVLVGASHNFEKRIVLAKVSKAVFHRPAVVGDTVVYTTEIESDEQEGALLHGTSCIGGELHGEVELFFAYLDERTIDGELIGPADLLALLRLYGVYDLGQKADGRPLEIPQRLLAAEIGALAADD